MLKLVVVEHNQHMLTFSNATTQLSFSLTCGLILGQSLIQQTHNKKHAVFMMSLIEKLEL